MVTETRPPPRDAPTTDPKARELVGPCGSRLASGAGERKQERRRRRPFSFPGASRFSVPRRLQHPEVAGPLFLRQAA